MLRSFCLTVFALGMFIQTSSAQKTRVTKPNTKTSTNTTTPTNTTTTQNATQSPLKTEVTAFGQSVIEAYFRRDCDFVWNKMDNTIKSIESGQSFTKSAAMKTEFCAENPLRTDISVSYKQYQNNYAPYVLTQAELAQKYPKIQESLQLQADDFFFDGSQLKQAGATSMFRASDMARFIVRKQAGNWVIIAI
jgi:hypothetical protein